MQVSTTESYDLKLMRLIFIVAIIFLASVTIIAQAPEYSWFKVYGSRNNDVGESLIQTPDGGYLLAGYSYYMVSGGADIYLVKTDEWGILEWEQAYGSYGDDWASCVKATADGGYILAGGTESYSEDNSDMLLMKIDSVGELVWQHTYGGQEDECANYVLQTFDGGYILSGWTKSFGAGADDIYLVKIDAAGEIEWSRTFGNEFYDKGYEVRQTSDSGYVLVAGLDYFAHYPVNAFVVKTNSAGETQWTSIIGGSNADACNAITETEDGGFVIVGWTMSYGLGRQDVYMVKIDSLGTVLWEKNYGGFEQDIGRSILLMPDGGFLVGGYTLSFGNGDEDVYIIRTDYKGDSLWTITFGGPEQDHADDIIRSFDGGMAVLGHTRSYGQGGSDILLVKYNDVQLNLDDDKYTLPKQLNLYGNYPNPFNVTTTIEFSLEQAGMVLLNIYDLLGREVKVVAYEYLNAGYYAYNFNAEGLASGTYLYRLSINGESQSQRMILLK